MVPDLLHGHGTGELRGFNELLQHQRCRKGLSDLDVCFYLCRRGSCGGLGHYRYYSYLGHCGLGGHRGPGCRQLIPTLLENPRHGHREREHGVRNVRTMGRKEERLGEKRKKKRYWVENVVCSLGKILLLEEVNSLGKMLCLFRNSLVLHAYR